ncbi:MAG: hypothetical protein RSD87_11475 [Cellulosilyticaceae bacterium]
MEFNSDNLRRTVLKEDDEQVYSLFKELLIAKRGQRAVEERLIKSLSKPLHRKWMDERVLDQYKHERMISEISREHLEKEMVLEGVRGNTNIHSSLAHELVIRLEAVENNIQFISNISQPIEDFKVYKMLNAIITDESIYQNRLVMMLNDR